MTPHDDFEAHDGPICDACEHCEDCCQCPNEGPGVIAVLLWTWGAVALALVGLYLGWLAFDSGWGFLLGLGIFFAANAIGGGDRHWALGALAGLAALLGLGYVAPSLSASAAAGFSLIPFGCCLFLGSWTLWTLRGLRRDRKAADAEVHAEAEDGIGKLESYLDGHRTVAAAAAPRRIIGLSGYAGAGKDTVAAELMFNQDYTRVSFADPIRALALAINPDIVVKPDEFGYHLFAVLDGALAVRPLKEVLWVFDGDWTEAKKVPAVRKFLQGLGAGVRDVIGEETWIDTAMRRLPDGNIVVTDCRFPNEAQAIKDAGGYVIRVSRPGVEAVNDHITEVGLDDWDFDAHVYNDGTPAAAREQMRKVEELLYDPDLAPADTLARP